MRILLAFVILLSIVALPGSADAAPSCNWGEEYRSALASFGESPALWSISPTNPEIDGQPMSAVTSDAGVVVSALVPCGYVRSVVTHEHMHLQQIRMFGTFERAGEVLAQDRQPGGIDALEITADCASMLAGSKYTPYVDRAGGCSERDLLAARQLLRRR
jgi:hypothetical protein